MLSSSFWDKREEAEKIVSELKSIKRLREDVENLESIINDNLSIFDEVKETDADMISLLESELFNLQERISKLELETYLSGEYDSFNVIMEIHAGAGGTESCDWANMLYRMYSRYAQRCGYFLTVLDKQDGEEVGIKSIMFQINGTNAYGYLKREKGVHRLVRISPFDSNKRRHTSFAAVEVTPDIDKNIDIQINETDIRVDIYRSSGPGGQGVNTTDSAVRITHIPTGIVVTCQNERSQIRNKEKCLEVLKSKLYALEIEKQNERLKGIKGEEMTNGWGSAKRSYVLCPYTLVKDNDSGYESSNVYAILDGEIEGMLAASLKVGD